MKKILIKLLNSKFKKDLIFSYFTQGVTIGFGFLQLFLINRYFGVEIKQVFSSICFNIKKINKKGCIVGYYF